MSSQREPSQSAAVQTDAAKLSVGQFAERFRREVIPLSNTFGYFCAAVPMSEDLVKEYLEEPIAALPPKIAAMLPKISILLVPYLERVSESASRPARRLKPPVEKTGDFVVSERPAEGHESWASQISFDDETVLVFALQEQDVAEYHYRLYRKLAALVADRLQKPENREPEQNFSAAIREELINGVHGEVDDDAWHSKQALLRRQSKPHRESPLLREYIRQAFIDTLTLYLHGICCDIDVETGPRQLPSRYLRKRLNILKTHFEAPKGYAVFPEDLQENPA